MRLEMFIGGAWVDVTDHWRESATITRGRTNEAEQVEPTRLNTTLDNAEGRFSPRNPLSPLYGSIGRNTPIRVVDGPSHRFCGEVSSWPQRWIPGHRDMWAPLEAAGHLRRERQGSPRLNSALRRALVRDMWVPSYVPMEDGPTARRFAPAPGRALGHSFQGEVSPASGSVGPASESVPTIGKGRITGSFAIPAQMHLANRISQVVHVPDQGVDNSPFTGLHLIRATGFGTASIWDLLLRNDGQVSVVALSSTGSQIFSSGFQDVGMNGGTWQVSIRLVNNATLTAMAGQASGRRPGQTTGWSFGGSISQWMLTWLGHSVGAIQAGGVFLGDMRGLAVGHVAVSLEDSDNTYDTTIAEAFSGHSGEPAAVRIQRLAAEQDVPVTITGDPSDSELMGPQRPETFLDLIDEAAAADMGVLGEDRETCAFTYRTRVDLYNQTPALTLDYEGGHVSPPLEPTDDDQHIANAVTVSTVGGSSHTHERESGPMSVQPPPDGVGRYETSASVNVAGEGLLPHQAGWRVHLGTQDRERYPRVTVDLRSRRVQPIRDDVLAVDVGDLIRITNTPEWIVGDVDLIVQGYTEDMTSATHEISFACTPAQPWTVATVGPDDPSEFGPSEPDRLDTLVGLFTAGLALIAGCYGLYLALLGPFYALVGDGALSSMPHSVSDIIFLPADPVYRVPIIRSLYDDYLNWWYVDPNMADRPTGWF
jgi:hypothetical protein